MRRPPGATSCAIRAPGAEAPHGEVLRFGPRGDDGASFYSSPGRPKRGSPYVGSRPVLEAIVKGFSTSSLMGRSYRAGGGSRAFPFDRFWGGWCFIHRLVPSTSRVSSLRELERVKDSLVLVQAFTRIA